ncbi:hypothetical protein TNCT_244311 [Trichonephila clavata]|uniref:Uncharacterized protein n=1 Tax=Trichonephila clavata TaxID=2740835 RepID=A0A8X6GIB3_TRICU|nr:hypothetical protein TNCT_244311 [Trichonephila clavata]
METLEKETRETGCSSGVERSSQWKCPGFKSRTSDCNSDACFKRILTFSRYLDASRLEWRPLEKESSREGCSSGVERSLRMRNVRVQIPHLNSDAFFGEDTYFF